MPEARAHATASAATATSAGARHLLLGGLLLVGTHGCAWRQLDSAERQAVRDGRCGIVLARLTATLDEKPLARTSEVAPFFDLHSLDHPLPPDTGLRAPAPSQTGYAAGWRYWVLPPGSYHLSVVPQGPVSLTAHTLSRDPQTGGYTYVATAATPPLPVPDYAFDVGGGGIRYIGSFHVAYEGRDRWLGPRVTGCRAVSVRDERAMAAAVAREAFPTCGPPHAALAEPTSLTLPASARPRLGSLGVRCSGPDVLTTPRLLASRTRRGAAYGGLLSGGGQGVLLTLPLGILGGSLAGGGAEATWHDALGGLATALPALHPEAVLRDAVLAALRQEGLAPLSLAHDLAANAPHGRPAPAAELVLTLRRVQLRRTSAGHYCIELAARARLLESCSRRSLLDRCYLYSHPLSGLDDVYTDAGRPGVAQRVPYETPVPEKSAARHLDEYGGDRGQALLREELGLGAAAVARQLVTDLGLRPGGATASGGAPTR